MMNPPESDDRTEFVEKMVEEALEPYRALLSPGDLAGMREYLLDLAYLHPTVSELVAQCAPRAVTQETAEVGTSSSEADGAVSLVSDEQGGRGKKSG